MRFMRQGAVAVVAMAFPLVASAQWEEDFDRYRDASTIIGQGGWTGFCGNARKDATVTALERISRPNGLKIDFTDIIYDKIVLGGQQFRVSMWIKIPNANQHNDLFITGYSEYNGDNCQLVPTIDAEFSFEGKVRDGLRRFEDVAIQYGDWKELRIDVDLNADTMAMYYDNRLVSEGLYRIVGGKKDLVAIGIDSASVSYIDDISVSVPPTCLYEQTKVKRKKCKDSRCPAVVPGCTTSNDAICNSVDDCKKKMKVKGKCNDPRENGKCVTLFAKCDCDS